MTNLPATRTPLIQLLAELNEPSAPQPADVSVADIATVVREVHLIQRQFGMLARAQKSPSYRLWLQGVDLGRRLFGRSAQYGSLDDFFTRGTERMDDLCSTTEKIVRYAHQENDYLVGVINRTLAEHEAARKSLQEISEKVPAAIKDYEALCLLMRDMKEDELREGLSFEQLERKRLDAERCAELTTLGAYQAMLRRLQGIKDALQFYTNMEKLFRYAYVTTEHVRNGCIQINTALKETHATYQQARHVFGAAMSLQQALETLTGYHRQLAEQFMQDMGKINGVLGADPNLDYIAAANARIGGMVQQVRQLEIGKAYAQERKAL